MSSRRRDKMREPKRSLDQQTEDVETKNQPSKPNYSLWFAVGIFLAAASYFFATRGPSTKPAKQNITNLPDSYALCTEHGKIYTMDSQTSKVDCILVRHDEILATGSINTIRREWDIYQDEQIKKFYGNEEKAKKPLPVVTPRTGSIVVPGLSDAHGHLIEYGFKIQLPLDRARTLSEVLDILEEYVHSHPEIEDDPSTWVEGWGWDQTRWKDWNGGFPVAADLASRPLLSKLPIALRRADGHATWVSPAALNITLRQLPGQRWPSNDEIDGGEIIRDANGNPTGVFLDNAILLIRSPPWTADQMESYFKRAMEDALSAGLTTVHDAWASEAFLDVFIKMADEGRMPIRVYAMASSENTTYWGKNIPKLEDYGEDGRLNVRSVKLFTDGALGSWGAALLEPYSDKPDTNGIMRSSPDALEAMVTKFWEDGWSTNIHCIGDRANKVVLDIYERLLTRESIRSGEDIRTIAARRRPRIEHAQIMRIEDLQRAGRLGVITSVQPTHATSDMWYAETRLGPERIKGAYAYQTLLQASPLNILPLGSDFPVEGINPLLGFYAAVSRLDTEGNSPHGASGWYASEKLTRAQALKGATIDAAYASFNEDKLGSLKPGKKADYVILDRDIMDEATPYTDILETVVLTTVIDGKIAFGSI